MCAAVELSSSAAFDRSERQGMLARICMARLEVAEIRTDVAAMTFNVVAINALMAAACTASEVLLADPLSLPTRAIDSDDDAVMAALQFYRYRILRVRFLVFGVVQLVLEASCIAA